MSDTLAEISVRYQGKLRCEATRVNTGESVRTDVGASHGGLDQCFSPIELAAAALGTCVTSVMAILAERNGVDLAPLEISVRTQMTSAPVRRIGAIGLTLRFPNGASISEVVRKKLEATANACPVKHSLHPDIHVTLEFVYE